LLVPHPQDPNGVRRGPVRHLQRANLGHRNAGGVRGAAPAMMLTLFLFLLLFALLFYLFAHADNMR
jgi:hypothetical protein